jgi:hypothetical protein
MLEFHIIHNELDILHTMQLRGVSRVVAIAILDRENANETVSSL